FDAVARRLEKTAGDPDRLRAEMGSVDASDYAALMAAQEALEVCLAERAALEDEWLELAERLGLDV
ncbi:ABC transporter ATP-binding protein, partial [Thermophilibacter sp. ET337]|nr:ABC transporter ATP-binding protein [Thermophilibacter sp. ET337]